MTKKTKQELLDYLTDNEYGVQSLIDMHDWLGTGSDSKHAAQEQQEAQDRLDYIVQLLKDAK
jgi:hypothetical protein